VPGPASHDTRPGTGSTEADTPPYRLYGAHASLYTGKTRSYLRKKGVPFEELLPCTPHFRRDRGIGPLKQLSSILGDEY